MEPTEHNRRVWDEVHRRPSEALHGQLGIPERIRPYVPDVSRKKVLHLQCATGESTAALVELGALVTGVDSSGEALAVARELAPTAALLQADVHALPSDLQRGRFDVVYTGGGVLERLHDLEAWAGGIAKALRPEGLLLLYDAHPVIRCVDDFLRWREDYFADASELWRLGQVVSAVAVAGLRVELLEEFPGTHHRRRQDARIPGEFVLLARKA